MQAVRDETKRKKKPTAGVLGISRYLEGTMMQPILPIFFRKKRRFSKGALLLFRLRACKFRILVKTTDW